MAVIEDLTEEEAAFWSIISDPSGLDLAEFCWTDSEQPDGCFRAWPFQWKWFKCTDQRQIDQMGRSLGKSLSIKMRAFAFPFLHPGQEMVITAPEGVHLDAVTDNVETALLSSRLGTEMVIRGRGGIKHRPFHVNFQNGARIMGRIPQLSGKGMKGTHPLWLELDEAQDFPSGGWTEIIETLKMGSQGAVWRAHGVTRGMRDEFYKFTQPGSGWTIHRATAMHRPTWDDEERQTKMQMYGSRDHPDYRRNILGLHGDATNPLFVLHRLMKCVDAQQSSEYNTDVYKVSKINNEMVLDNDDDILNLLTFPEIHKQKYKLFWIGMDIGLTLAPSSIMIFAEERIGKASKLRLIMRIMLERISNPAQVQAILHIISHYRPQAFSMDSTGIGLPMFQEIQNKAENNPGLKPVLDIIKGYNFSSKILVDFDQRIEVDEFTGDMEKEAGMYRNVLEYSSDKLRQIVDEERVILPWDEVLIREFQGSSWSYDKNTVDMYGRKKRYNKGEFHNLDAARMAVLGYTQYAIETMMKKEKWAPVTDIFVSF